MVGMHSIFFGVKRAFHATLRRTRRPFAQVQPGLTAARYDVLYALQSHDSELRQSKLRDLLGVTGATISRMLRALERLRVVWRERDPLDRRRLIVRLTDLGDLWVRWADRRLLQEVALAIDAAFTARHSDADCLWAKLCFDDALDAFRATFGDRAHLVVHPGWRLDD
jgi:DNA-binding MarR family transcriptional regulator